MKTNKTKGDMFSFLMKNYMLNLVVTMFFIIAAIILMNMMVNNYFFSTDIGLESEQSDIISGNFNKIDVKKIAGKNGGIEIIDEEGNVVFSKGMEGSDSEYDLNEIQDINDDYYSISKEEFNDKQNNKLILITKYNIWNNEKSWFMLLNGDYDLINSSGNIPYEKEKFSAEEIQNLFKNHNAPSLKYKYPFTTSDNRNYIMLIKLESSIREQNKNLDTFFTYSPLILLGIFIICSVVFIILLSRKIRKPIDEFNNAMLSYSEGELTEVVISRAPKEFMNISDTFNNMIGKIKESEERDKRHAEEKQKIIADISHDLKTPITIIKGYAKALADGKIPKGEEQKYLDIILNKSSLLTELINLFHDYSKMEHPDYKIYPKKEKFTEMIRTYIAEIYNYVYDLGFFLEIDICEEEIYCNIDQTQFKRVIWNIISNALKYNPKGTTINIRLYEADKNVKLEIADDGIGIEETLREKIFDAFVVGDDSRSTVHGTGLGLAITKKIITEHGGNIYLEKYNNKGIYKTVFVIELEKIK